MNCVYCFQPVSASPVDQRGIATMPETVHLDCVNRHYQELGQVIRKIPIPSGATTVKFRKWEPLTTTSEPKEN